MTQRRQPSRPLALAAEWVAKITTVALEMVLPTAGGAYLDRRLGTNYWALLGVVLGMVVGLWHLLQMTRPKSSGPGEWKRGGNSGGPADE